MTSARAAGACRVEPVAIIAVPAKKLDLTESPLLLSAVQRLADALAIECSRRHDLENPWSLRRGSQQVIKGGNTPVVQVREVGPDARERRRRIAATSAELALPCQRALLEGLDELA